MNQPAERAAKRICAALPPEDVGAETEALVAKAILQEIKIQIRRENAEYKIHTAPTRQEMVMETILTEFDAALLVCRDEKPQHFADRALYHALRRWQTELPVPDHYFHKAFRQCDVVDTTVAHGGGHGDMVLWCLLSQSKLFWQIFEKHTYEK